MTRDTTILLILLSATLCAVGVVLSFLTMRTHYPHRSWWLMASEWSFFCALLGSHICGVQQFLDVSSRPEAWEFVYAPGVILRASLVIIPFCYYMAMREDKRKTKTLE